MGMLIVNVVLNSASVVCLALAGYAGAPWWELLALGAMNLWCWFKWVEGLADELRWRRLNREYRQLLRMYEGSAR